jgi:hypothetical protein
LTLLLDQFIQFVAVLLRELPHERMRWFAAHGARSLSPLTPRVRAVALDLARKVVHGRPGTAPGATCLVVARSAPLCHWFQG